MPGDPRVPMPEAHYDTRTKLIQAYGTTDVMWAEIAVCVQLLFAAGIVKPAEFSDLVQRQLARTDARRREAAGDSN